MEPAYIAVINIGLNAILLIGGYLVKQVINSMKQENHETHKMIQDLEYRVRAIETAYVPRTELKGMFLDLMSEIRRLNDRLDSIFHKRAKEE